MPSQIRTATALFAAALLSAACGGHDSRAEQAAPRTTTPPSTAVAPESVAVAPHHSKLAGAAVGALAGHMLGGHAMMGAAAGAMVQHERNKHP